jgi:hypothetical protein
MRRLLLTLALLVALVVPAAAQIFGDRQTITVVDSGTACVTAPTACATFSLDSNSSSVAISVAGTWTGTLTFEGTADNQVWTVLNMMNLATTVRTTTTTANGLWGFGNAGIIRIRVRATAAVTGTAVIAAARGSGLP